MEHHDLDINPISKESKPLLINEPWLIDRSLQWIQETGYDPTPLPDDDNIRVYLPMDICKSAILRRLADCYIALRASNRSKRNGFFL